MEAETLSLPEACNAALPPPEPVPQLAAGRHALASGHGEHPRLSLPSLSSLGAISTTAALLADAMSVATPPLASGSQAGDVSEQGVSEAMRPTAGQTSEQGQAPPPTASKCGRVAGRSNVRCTIQLVQRGSTCPYVDHRSRAANSSKTKKWQLQKLGSHFFHDRGVPSLTRMCLLQEHTCLSLKCLCCAWCCRLRASAMGVPNRGRGPCEGGGRYRVLQQVVEQVQLRDSAVEGAGCAHVLASLRAVPKWAATSCSFSEA